MPQKRFSLYLLYPRYLAGLVCVIAALVLVGWQLELRELVQIRRDFAPMQFNTALCFVLLALAALCGTQGTSRRCATVFSLGCFLLAGMSGLQYVLNLNFGIDTLFVVPFVSTKTSHLGRMAPNTALCFVLLAWSVFAVKWGRNAVVQLLAGIVMLVALSIASLALIGYAGNFEMLFGWSQYTRMAWHTALCFLLLSLALVLQFERRISRIPQMRRLWHASAILAVGFFVSMSFWASAEVDAQHNIRAKFQKDVSLYSALIENELRAKIDILQSVERFFSSSDFVSEAEFHSYVDPFVDDQTSILAIDYAPRVDETQRGRVEKELFQEHAMRFRQLGPERTLVSRSEASIYFPVRFTEPPDFEQSAYGFDHYSDPLRTVAMDAAAQARSPMSTVPFRLFRIAGVAGIADDILVVVPIYRKQKIADEIVDATDASVEGFVVGVFRLSRLVSDALESVPSPGLQYSLTTESERQKVHVFSTRILDGQRELFSLSPIEAISGLQDQTSFILAGRLWTQVFAPTAEYVAFKKSRLPNLLLIAGFIFTIMTGLYVFFMQRRRDILLDANREKNTALELLRERDEWFSQLAQTAPIGIFRTDNLGRCLYINRAWAEMTGLSWDEAKGEGWIAAIHLDDRRQVSAEWSASVAGGKPFSQMFRFRRPDGAIRWVATSAMPVIADSGVVIGYVGTNFDYTPLQQSSEALKAATEAKSLFLANMSHEIRTPITSIVGFSESLLQDELEKAERDAALEAIMRNAEHLRTLVNDILDFSKIEAGKLELDRTQIDLRSFIGDISQIFQSSAQQKGISFGVNWLYPYPRSVVLDETRLRQIVINLIGNAIKFTESGGVKLTVSYDQATDEMKFIVTDTGVGIAKEKLEKLFTLFEQGELSTTKRFGGTGLGLAISRRLAHLMRGEISVESTIGVGSSFTLRLPLGEEGSEELVYAEERVASRTPLAETLQNQFNGRILLAEDGLDNQALVKRLLERLGLQVAVVENGAQALDMVERESFDLILLDMHMPEVDGFAAAKLMRNWGVQTPIIAFTAEGTVEGRRRCLASGCNEILSKPFRRDEFLGVMARYLTNQEVHNEDLLNFEDSELKAIREGFVQRLPERLQRMQRLLQQGDLSALQQEAHKLRGAGMFGEVRLGALAADLERSSSIGELSVIKRIVDEIASLVSALCAAPSLALPAAEDASPKS